MNRRFEIRQRVTPRHSKSIKSYLNELNNPKYNPIPKEQELELMRKYKEDGCNKSKEKVLNANLRFVVSVAKAYNKNKVCLNLIDLISIGNQGIIKAIERFDIESKNKFLSYSVWWIRQAVLEEIKAHSNTIRIPHNGLQIQSKKDKFIDSFYNEFGAVPHTAHIAENIKETENSIRNVSSCQYTKSLNSFISSDADTTYQDLLEDKSEQIDEAYPSDKRVMLESLLKILDEREQSILMSFYGMKDGQTSKSFTTVGEEHNLTRERIRQIISSAIRKLRAYIRLNNLQLNEYL